MSKSLKTIKKSVNSKEVVPLTEVPMKKELVMYFRVKEVKRKHFKMIDGIPTTDVSAKGAVTVIADFFDHPQLGRVLMWGGSLCLPTDLFNKKEGKERAYEHALENLPEYITKVVSYEKAKNIAKVIANQVWKNRGLEKSFNQVFDLTNELIQI